MAAEPIAMHSTNSQRKPSLEVAPTTLAQKLDKHRLGQLHTVQRLPPPRQTEIGTVPLPPAFSPYCAT